MKNDNLCELYSLSNTTTSESLPFTNGDYKSCNACLYDIMHSVTNPSCHTTESYDALVDTLIQSTSWRWPMWNTGIYSPLVVAAVEFTLNKIRL